MYFALDEPNGPELAPGPALAEAAINSFAAGMLVRTSRVLLCYIGHITSVTSRVLFCYIGHITSVTSRVLLCLTAMRCHHCLHFPIASSTHSLP